jgi:3-deoxy-D-manno-octulosonate 8-phosphate phosphatase (KDO 8-P phosphatase)
MVIDENIKNNNSHLKKKIENIKIILTDSDGVLTDTGVYYSEKGEELKRFSIRDGMGIERLRKHLGIETIIVTGEGSGAVVGRAKKLKLNEYYLGVKDKLKVLDEVLRKNGLTKDNVAFIGDDINDYEIMQQVGLSASPADGMSYVKSIADYVCENKGGQGAFREFAELIIAFLSKK